MACKFPRKDKFDKRFIIHKNRKNIVFGRIERFIICFSSDGMHYKKHSCHNIIKPKDKRKKFYFVYTQEKIGDYYLIELNCFYFNASIQEVIEKIRTFKEYAKTGSLIFWK